MSQGALLTPLTFGTTPTSQVLALPPQSAFLFWGLSPVIRPALDQMDTWILFFYCLFVCFNLLLNMVQHGSITLAGGCKRRSNHTGSSYKNPSIHAFIPSSLLPFPPPPYIMYLSIHHPSIHSYSIHPPVCFPSFLTTLWTKTQKYLRVPKMRIKWN